MNMNMTKVEKYFSKGNREREGMSIARWGIDDKKEIHDEGSCGKQALGLVLSFDIVFSV